MNYHCTMNRPSSFYFCESGVFLSGSSYLLTAVGTSKTIGPLCISVCLWVLIEFFHDKWPLTYSSSLKVNVRVHDPWEKDVFGLWMHVLSMHVTTWKVFDFFVELIVLKCQCDLDWGYCSCFVDRVNSDIVVSAVSLGIVDVDSDSDLLSMRSLVNQLIQVASVELFHL